MLHVLEIEKACYVPGCSPGLEFDFLRSRTMARVRMREQRIACDNEGTTHLVHDDLQIPSGDLIHRKLSPNSRPNLMKSYTKLKFQGWIYIFRKVYQKMHRWEVSGSLRRRSSPTCRESNIVSIFLNPFSSAQQTIPSRGEPKKAMSNYIIVGEPKTCRTIFRSVTFLPMIECFSSISCTAKSMA